MAISPKAVAKYLKESRGLKESHEEEQENAISIVGDKFFKVFYKCIGEMEQVIQRHKSEFEAIGRDKDFDFSYFEESVAEACAELKHSFAGVV